MGKFLYGDKVPSSITYNGAAIDKLYFDDVLVWEANCDCDCDCDCDCTEDCDCSADGE